MNFNKFSYFLLLIVAFASLIAADSNAQGFQRTYGGTGIDEAKSIALTSDGGSIISGETQSFGAGNKDSYLIKLDASGEIEWSKTYGGSNIERGSIVIQTSDGGYMLGSYTYSFGVGSVDYLLIKTDPQGVVQWSNSYGLSIADYPRDLVQTSDGGYLVGGVTNSIGAGGSDCNIFKVDASGTLQWTRTYGNNFNEFIHSLDLTPDGGFIISGYRRDYFIGNDQAYLTKIDSVGTIQWAKTYSGSVKENGNGITVTSTGYLICGITNSVTAGDYDYFVMNLDFSGNIIWANAYGGSAEDRGNAAVETPGGDFYLLGSMKSFGSGGTDLGLIKIDAAGGVLSAMTIGWSGEENTWAASNNMKLASDGSILISGKTNSVGAGQYDVLVIKTGSDGVPICANQSISPTVTSIAPTVVTNTPSVNTTDLVQNSAAVQVSSPTTLDSLICLDISPCNLIASFSSNIVCEGDTTTFIDLSTDLTDTIITWKWFFGDGDSLIGNANPTHTYPMSGSYSTMLIVGNNASPVCYDTVLFQTLVLSPISVGLGNDTTLCQGATLNLVASIGGAAYLWQDGTTSSSIQVTTPGTYWLEVTVGSCVNSDTINVSYNDIPAVDLGIDTMLCESDSLVLDISAVDGSYMWQDGSTNSSFTVSQTGTYTVTILDSGCVASDTIFIGFTTPPSVDLGNDTTLCQGAVLNLVSSVGGAVYLWQDGTTSSSTPVTTPGTYWLQVISGGCPNSDTINIFYNDIPTVDLGQDTTLCEGNSLILDISTVDGTYLWQDGSSNASLTVTQTGTYSVTITDSACVASDSIIVAFITPSSVNLGSDTILCAGESLTLDAFLPGATYLWQDNSTNATYTVTVSGVYWAEIAINGCSASDTVLVQFEQPVVVDLGKDTSLCPGVMLTLDASMQGASYLWNDATTDATNSVVVSGQYWVQVRINNCLASDTVAIAYYDQPILNLGGDTSICEGTTFQLNTNIPAVSYQWQDNSTLASITVSETGVYWVMIQDQCGVLSDSVEVNVSECSCLLCVPDAFSPNGSGPDANDKFYVFDKLWESGDALESIEFRIYNRWGELIFDATDRSQIIYPDGGWDGTNRRNQKPMEVGVYVWVLHAVSVNGVEFGPMSGNVSLLR